MGGCEIGEVPWLSTLCVLCGHSLRPLRLRFLKCVDEVKPFNRKGRKKAEKAAKDAKRSWLDEMFAIAFPQFSSDNARFN